MTLPTSLSIGSLGGFIVAEYAFFILLLFIIPQKSCIPGVHQVIVYETFGYCNAFIQVFSKHNRVYTTVPSRRLSALRLPTCKISLCSILVKHQNQTALANQPCVSCNVRFFGSLPRRSTLSHLQKAKCSAAS